MLYLTAILFSHTMFIAILKLVTLYNYFTFSNMQERLRLRSEFGVRRRHRRNIRLFTSQSRNRPSILRKSASLEAAPIPDERVQLKFAFSG